MLVESTFSRVRQFKPGEFPAHLSVLTVDRTPRLAVLLQAEQEQWTYLRRDLQGNLPAKMRFRTLVVDDVEDFRHFVCSMLKQETECEVVGEASDGLQAVLQAQQLQPDLILLDVGIPTLNGIEAARRIRKLSPNSKILFVTEHCSREISEGALRTGAAGYLLKSDAAQLPCAVETVLRGGQFVSKRVMQKQSCSLKSDFPPFTGPESHA